MSFLADLIEHGDKMVAADLPSDTRKVLGALISWTQEGGKFVEPEVFNPAADQAVYEEQAESARLAARVEALEAQLTAAPPGASAGPPAGVPVIVAPETAAPSPPASE
jgi:hypothetical protein